MTACTRIIRLSELADRAAADNEGTRVGPFIDLASLDLRRLFNRSQAELSQRLLARPERGWLLSVLGPKGIGGSLWLAATGEYRAGSIGRHACVDLYLPRDGALSLRHCVAVVHALDDCVRLHLVDLCSTAGLSTESGEAVQAVDAGGPLLLRVPGGLLVCLPTGGRLPWNPESMDAFGSLPPRPVLRALTGKGRRERRPRLRDLSEITLCPGPIDSSMRLCLPEEAPAGRLVIESSHGRLQLAVGFSALEAGLLLGRDPRCVGASILSHEWISRVHALLLRRDGTTLLADCGSTNGTWCEGDEVGCIPVRADVAYHLSEHASIRWEPLD